MKSVLKAFGLAALAGAIVLPAQAGDDKKDLKKVIEDQGINYVETAQKGITLSGYVDTSYTEQFAGGNEFGPAGYTTSTPNSHAALRQFDTSNNTFNVDAVKIALEKALPDKNEWAAGFRIDTIYGNDAKYLGDGSFNGLFGANHPSAGVYTTGGTTANNSGLALEQALVKFRVPVGNGLDFYVGKFVTFLGYEVIESPANLNFSRGLLFTNAIPLTHTGVYADYKFNDTFEAKFGIVDGWNNSTTTAPTNSYSYSHTNESNGFGKALTGQLNITAPGKNANICQSFIYSPEGEANVVGIDNGPVVVYDIWGNWNPTFVKDSALLLGFNIDLGYNGASGVPQAYYGSGLNGATPVASSGVYDSNTWWGAALYAQYKFNKVFSLSGRLEYLHEDAAFFQKFAGSGNTDDYSATLTASFNIWDNLLTRIEYRHDLLDLGAPGGTNQDEISLNAVYSF